MEGGAGNAPCEHFEANVLAQSRHQNCFHPEEAHRARHQVLLVATFSEPKEFVPTLGLWPGCGLSPELWAPGSPGSPGRGPRPAGSQEPRSPPSAEVPYCDLPRRLPASVDPHSASTSGRQSVVGLGLGPGSERGPSAGLPAEGPAVTPRSRSREPEAVPYLEGLASSPCGSSDEGPDSGTSSGPDSNTPDDTSNSSSVDWDIFKRQEEAPSWDKFTMMIPRKLQEGSRADGAQRAPSILTRSPVGGETGSQRKEDTGSGSRSAGQHWAKLRGESGHFLERHRSALSQASSVTPQSGPRSTTPRASSLQHAAQRDVVQTASMQPDTPQASSPSQIAQQDSPRTLSTQQDTSRTSSTQRNIPRASSPSRVTQRDNPRTLSTQRSNPRVSSSPRATQQDPSRTSSTRQDNPRGSSPNRTTQRENSRTSCAQRDNPRGSSPNRTPPHHPASIKRLSTTKLLSTLPVPGLLSDSVFGRQGLVAHNVNLKPGGCLRVRGEVPADPKRFAVNLGKDSNNLSLHINPRFKYYGEVNKIVYNSKKAGAWETELRDTVFPFKPGSVIEVCITFDQAELTIKMPDGHTFKFPNRHNVDTIDYLETNGDFKLKRLTFE